MKQHIIAHLWDAERRPEASRAARWFPGAATFAWRYNRRDLYSVVI